MSDDKELFERIKQRIIDSMLKAIEEVKEDVIKVVKDRVGRGQKSDGSDFSPYSTRHKSRRNKEGLQTGTKDLKFSGHLFDNFKEIKRTITDTSIEVTIGFEGQHKRRSDQKGASNQDVAMWLSIQEKGSIVKLSEEEKTVIINKVREKFNYHLKI